MSNMPSLLLPFLFLHCLSICACDARHLRGIVLLESRSQVRLSGKDLEKEGKLDKTSIPSTTKLHLPEENQRPKQEAENGETRMDKCREGASTHEKSKGSDASLKKVKISGAVQTESLVSVPRRVPRKKSGQYPGFNLDYSPPKTHPPSHN
ncbi:PREDICTED: uncharacterized protein LOC104602315 [Nelumbo nucifera]|uniref:Uncharacterized protein LOC104602315 n=1 Tax=Nelumbo nucifera TaxID=4432 RepID=A0A1U8A9X8_NELNU|nr:PREDICTED: uncharacterized protein LOC104602315 [Nelumbo nucifera]